MIHIGTSGWSYAHWKENFYPHGLSTKKWLDYYASVFSTVEVNSSFYHLPKDSTIQTWYNTVPADFLFSLKASRYITHRKKLHDCKDSVDYLIKTLANLKSKLGPILFQLAPTFKINKERLVDFLTYLDPRYSYAFEFRHPSWFIDDIYSLLSKQNIALCISDLKGKLTPEEMTADFTYIRLHGPQNSYQGFYGKPKLMNWKKKIEKWSAKTSVYCYFDNDEKGFAVKDALTLKDLLK